MQVSTPTAIAPAWVKVLSINPEFRILIASLISFQMI